MSISDSAYCRVIIMKFFVFSTSGQELIRSRSELKITAVSACCHEVLSALFLHDFCFHLCVPREARKNQSNRRLYEQNILIIFFLNFKIGFFLGIVVFLFFPYFLRLHSLI